MTVLTHLSPPVTNSFPFGSDLVLVFPQEDFLSVFVLGVYTHRAAFSPVLLSRTTLKACHDLKQTLTRAPENVRTNIHYMFPFDGNM